MPAFERVMYTRLMKNERINLFVSILFRFSTEAQNKTDTYAAVFEIYVAIQFFLVCFSIVLCCDMQIWLKMDGVLNLFGISENLII